MMQPLGDSIIFTFVDEVRKGVFIEQSTSSGIYVGFSHQDSSQKAREANVVAVGPRVTEVKKGDRILIEPLMWTDSFKFDKVEYWTTKEEKVIGIYNKD